MSNEVILDNFSQKSLIKLTTLILIRKMEILEEDGPLEPCPQPVGYISLDVIPRANREFLDMSQIFNGNGSSSSAGGKNHLSLMVKFKQFLHTLDNFAPRRCSSA